MAKELGLSSHALIKLMKEQDIPVKGHMSSVAEENIHRIRGFIAKERKKLKKEIHPAKGKDKKRAKVDETVVQETLRRTIAQMERRHIKHRYHRKEKDEVKKRLEAKVVKVFEFQTVGELADLIDVEVSEVIKKCLDLGLIATVNQRLDFDTISLIASEFGIEVELAEEDITKPEEGKEIERPPVVTFMGHVDHGKTSLLDAIRSSEVVKSEFGRITQHFGAYRVKHGERWITFLDTPGHEAFTTMRARGTQVTDFVILVVAADDGVMPQTIEAIDHAKAAGVPIIVCINKIDLPNANVQRVKTQLSQHGLMIEEFGGKILCVETSALKKIGLDQLLETILLQAEMLDLKACPIGAARGVVLESILDRGKGNVATILIQSGLLRKGDTFVCGISYGRVREMFDEEGGKIPEAKPAMPVLVLGFNSLPEAGEIFQVVSNEAKARDIAQRRTLIKKSATSQVKRITLYDLQQRIQSGELKELKVILKGDVAGSVEALSEKIEGMSVEEASLNVIHRGVGPINTSDVRLAQVTSAICVGFHVGFDPMAKELAEAEGVELRTYRLIYEAIDDLRSALLGMLEPEITEVETGRLEVRQVFSISRLGLIAGCYVKEGKAVRGADAKLIRDSEEIFRSVIFSLKRFKEDVKEVEQGFECGVGLEGVKDIKEGDEIVVIIKEEKQRVL
ncbi:MAG TPA: translation initiation factor IF-2 [bacterium (Candidatus Stahlbacteria)]|nr:translation initiation factor IF-2 [Candidatus Stahlbacteria bacterium]